MTEQEFLEGADAARFVDRIMAKCRANKEFRDQWRKQITEMQNLAPRPSKDWDSAQELIHEFDAMDRADT